MAVSRKVDTRAVGRNRIKRVLRETTRQITPWLAMGDYVVVARSAAAKASNTELREAFLRVLRRAGALPQSMTTGTMPPPLAGAPSSLSPQVPEPRSD
jgi:ribonuclease P protein component